MSVFKKSALVSTVLGVVIAGNALAGQVSVIPPTAIITPPPPAPTPAPTPAPAPTPSPAPPVAAPTPVPTPMPPVATPTPVAPPVVPGTPPAGMPAPGAPQPPVAATTIPLTVTPAPPPVPAATAARVPQVIGSFPVSAMSTSGLVQAAELTQQAIENPSLGPEQVEALTNLNNAISGELDLRR